MTERKSCCELFKQINTALEKRANNDLKSIDLTNSQILALFVLLEDMHGERVSYKDMEKKLHLAQSTTVGIISRLEKKGLVMSFESPKNKRVRFVQITESGKDCCKNAVKIMDNTESDMLKGMTAEERSELYLLLSKVAGNLL